MQLDISSGICSVWANLRNSSHAGKNLLTDPLMYFVLWKDGSAVFQVYFKATMRCPYEHWNTEIHWNVSLKGMRNQVLSPVCDLRSPSVHLSIHPSIVSHVSRVGLWKQQGTPDFPFQLWLGDPDAFPGQCGDIISPSGSGRLTSRSRAFPCDSALFLSQHFGKVSAKPLPLNPFSSQSPAP